MVSCNFKQPTDYTYLVWLQSSHLISFVLGLVYFCCLRRVSYFLVFTTTFCVVVSGRIRSNIQTRNLLVQGKSLTTERRAGTLFFCMRLSSFLIFCKAIQVCQSNMFTRLIVINTWNKFIHMYWYEYPRVRLAGMTSKLIGMTLTIYHGQEVAPKGIWHITQSQRHRKPPRSNE